MNVPLVNLGSLMLYATRRTVLLPNIAFVRRYDGQLETAALMAEAERVGRNPFGVGRTLYMPKVPGARPLWRASTNPPPVAVAPDAADSAALATWLADELSVREDPLDGEGWHMARIYTEDATFVAVVASHLYGAGRDIVESYFHAEHPAGGESNGRASRWASLSTTEDHDLASEFADLRKRIRTGVTGVASMFGQLAPSRQKRDSQMQGSSEEPKGLAALFDKDPSRGKPSTRRVIGLGSVELSQWEEVAKAHDGSSVALQVAIVANLLREARAARGGPTTRPIRMLMPVDVTDRSEETDETVTIKPPMLTSANVVLPGGLASHHSLAEIQDTYNRAVLKARAKVAATGDPNLAPGAINAMRLLPDAITARAVFRFHAGFDGALSAMGKMPRFTAEVGGSPELVATDIFCVGFPLGSDLNLTTSEFEGKLTMAAVADPSRLGVGPSLRERLEAELHNWGLEGQVW